MPFLDVLQIKMNLHGARAQIDPVARTFILLIILIRAEVSDWSLKESSI